MARKNLPNRFDVAALLKIQGRHSIDHGLSLQVSGGSALWNFQWRDKLTRRGRSKVLGSASIVSITEARRLRDAFRERIRTGTVPITAATSGKSFSAVLDAYIAGHAKNLKGGIDGKEGRKFTALHQLSIAKYPIGAITRTHVAAALAPWDGRASCDVIRGKIERVMDYAKGHGLFTGDNPAEKGPLQTMVALKSKTAAKHHPMLDWRAVPALFAELSAIDTPASRALRFTLLTAARPSEAREAVWSEINGDVWTIPPDRMKEAKLHTVPLAPAALDILGARGDGLIFGKIDRRKVVALIKHRMSTDGRPCDVHGLRSSFFSWASEMRYSADLAEMALSHAVGDSVRRAYDRSDKINERREMMEAWAKFAMRVQ